MWAVSSTLTAAGLRASGCSPAATANVSSSQGWPRSRAQHRPCPAPPCNCCAAGMSHFKPRCWDLLIRGPSHLDPPDIWQPPGRPPSPCTPLLPCSLLAWSSRQCRHSLPASNIVLPEESKSNTSRCAAAPAGFTGCTVPLVWWVPYFSIFADLFLNSAVTLDAMQSDGAMDRRAASLQHASTQLARVLHSGSLWRTCRQCRRAALRWQPLEGWQRAPYAGAAPSGWESQMWL